MALLNPAYIVFAAAILTASWSDETTTHEPATTMSACLDATVAYARGIGVPDAHRGQRAVTTTCVPTPTGEAAGFKPGWDCIQGYNCGERK